MNCIYFSAITEYTFIQKLINIRLKKDHQILNVNKRFSNIIYKSKNKKEKSNNIMDEYLHVQEKQSILRNDERIRLEMKKLIEKRKVFK